MRLPHQSAGVSRGFRPGTRIRRRGVSPSLPIFAKCSSDDGDSCDCPKKFCVGGPAGCAGMLCPTGPGGPGGPRPIPTAAAFDL